MPLPLFFASLHFPLSKKRSLSRLFSRKKPSYRTPYREANPFCCLHDNTQSSHAKSCDFSVLGGVRIVLIAIQRFSTTDVTTDWCDPAIHSAISEQPAIGHRCGRYRDHMEEQQNSVYDRRRGWSLPRLKLGGSETLLRPRGSLRYPDSHLQHTVVRRTSATCIRAHRIFLLITIKCINALCYLGAYYWRCKCVMRKCNFWSHPTRKLLQILIFPQITTDSNIFCVIYQRYLKYFYVETFYLSIINILNKIKL